MCAFNVWALFRESTTEITVDISGYVDCCHIHVIAISLTADWLLRSMA